MTSPASWLSITARDAGLLDLLTRRVRSATVTQVARRSFGGSIAAAGKRLRRLQSAGLVVTAAPLVRQLSLTEPLMSWRPHHPEPDFDALSWRARGRWRGLLPKAVRAVWATAAAVRLVGGCGGEVRQPLQVEHDLHVTEVFLQLESGRPALTDRWISEDVYRRRERRGKVPDGVLLDSAGRAVRWMEFAGSYSAGRIRSFHRCCEREGLPYELW